MEDGISIIEDIIRSYPNLKAKMMSRRQTKLIASYKESLHGDGGRKDPTAVAALAELPPEEQRRYEAVKSAIYHTRSLYQNGSERMRVIQLSYWTKAEEQRTELNEISALTAQEYRKDFIRAVSDKMGLNDCNGCMYWRRLLNTTGIMACHFCYDTGRPRSHLGSHCYSKNLGMQPATYIDKNKRRYSHESRVQ